MTRSTLKKLGLVVLGSSFVGVAIGLAVAQDPDDDDQGPPAKTLTKFYIPPPPELEQARALALKAKRPAGKGGKSRRRGAMSAKGTVDGLALIELSKSIRRADIDAEVERRMTTYAGTVVVPDFGAKVGQPKLRGEIAAAFTANDPITAERRAHFQWLAKYPTANPQGWYAAITKIEPGLGGAVATVEVSPIFQTSGGVLSTPDKCVERWLYRDGSLQPLPNPHDHTMSGAILLD